MRNIENNKFCFVNNSLIFAFQLILLVLRKVKSATSFRQTFRPFRPMTWE